ncbi:MAG TPA: hypothetical protein VF756_01065 [Thermoanaerobaculia bacterium]
MRRIWAVGALIAVAGAASSAAISMSGTGDGGVVGDPPELSPPSAELGLTLVDVPAVALAPMDHGALLAEDEVSSSEESYKVLRVGVGRAMSVSQDDGQWHDFEPAGEGEEGGEGEEEEKGASLWVADVVSTGAVGLRLHFPGLPPGGRLAVYAPAGERPLDVQIFEASDSGDGGFWSGSVSGERARIEIYYPGGRPGPEEQGAAVVDEIQHLYRDPLAAEDGFSALAAASCHNDVTCHPTWANVAKGVGRITYMRDGSTFLCSGQLINPQNNDGTPYFLTAHHCISTQSVAQTAEVYWRYQTSTCNGSPPPLPDVAKSRAATLLSTGASADYTLLMIEGALPSGLFWVGWTTGFIPDGTASTGIHHPRGDHKRITFGSRSGPPTCGPSEGHKMGWSDGITEKGSSGSGIFRDSDQRLYGQLSCGASACDNTAGDTYGSFAAAYPNFSSLLAGGSDDFSEENDTCAAAKTVVEGTYNDRIVKGVDTDWYKIAVPFGSTLTVTLTFTHANGNINARLYGTCGGSQLASATGSSNTETLTYTNLDVNSILSPPTLKWQVFLASDTRNGYKMNIAVTQPTE